MSGAGTKDEGVNSISTRGKPHIPRPVAAAAIVLMHLSTQLSQMQAMQG